MINGKSETHLRAQQACGKGDEWRGRLEERLAEHEPSGWLDCASTCPDQSIIAGLSTLASIFVTVFRPLPGTQWGYGSQALPWHMELGSDNR